MKSTAFILTLLVILFASGGASAQTIGLYFDEAGTIPYVDETDLSYPSTHTVYLIAKDLNVDYGIGGWEAGLQYSEDLTIYPGALSGTAINITSFPNFTVGLAAPLGQGTGTALLSTFYVVANGPGYIYINASSRSSIPSSELPCLVQNHNIAPFGIEFGGEGFPSAAIGHAITQPNPAGLDLVSPIKQLEFRDDGVYASIGTEKSWIKLPTVVEGQPLVLTPDQETALTLVPRLKHRESTDKDVGVVLFQDDFERYSDLSEIPFETDSVTSQFYPRSWGTEEFENSGLYSYWGVTSFEGHGKCGFATAHRAACYYPEALDDCDWLTTQPIRNGYDEGVQSVLELSQTLPMDAGKTYRIAFDALAKRVDFGEDGVAIDFIFYFETTDPDNNHVVGHHAPIGRILHETTWDYRVKANYSISESSLDPRNLQMYWSFDSGSEYDTEGGFYIDNIEILEHNTDLEFTSVAIEAPENVGDPWPITIRVDNLGEMDSGDFSIGYRFDGSDEIVEKIQVPSIPTYEGFRNVDFPIHFQRSNKEGSETIEKKIIFMVDCDDVIPELSEYNNDSSVQTLSWEVYNAPVILIHGFMGGALEKDGLQVYGEDLLETMYSMLFEPERIKRLTNENFDKEFDGGGMRVPSAYPPENGFLREPTLGVPLSALMRTFPPGIGSDIGGPDVTLYNRGGMWKGLIDNLVLAPTGGVPYVIPQ